MTDAKIKSIPDEELQYRSQQVKANNKEIFTPIKAIDPTKIEPGISISKKVGGITEIYFGLKKNRILNHLQGNEHTLDYALNAIDRKIKDPDKETPQVLCLDVSSVTVLSRSGNTS